MGEVFRARDTRLERKVAVKILPAEFAANAALKLRFEREARAISQLNHPHICTLHDVGSDDGVEYLVMELIEGESLADRLARGPLPLADVLKYGAEIAEGLDAAHRAGIVHRDLKPGNVMLTRAGAKLLDFGLARRAAALTSSWESNEESVQQDSRTAFKPLTAEGTIVGTFQYMAPEQLEGEEADPRTDIFALGCVLYEMLTGRRAFEGKTRTSLIAAIVSSEPAPVSSLVPLTPPALEHVVRRCLAKERDSRWQSAQDVAAELRWISETASQPAAIAAGAPASKRTRERLLWAAALIAAVAATAAIAPGLRRSPPGPAYHFTIPASDTDYTKASWPMISPDARSAVFVAQKSDGTTWLYVRRLDGFAVRPLMQLDPPFSEPFWSPDARYVAVRHRGKLWRVDVQGGQPQSIADVSGMRDGDWGADGTILIGQLEGPLQQLSTRGGAPVAITRPDPSKFERGHHAPSFLPDGRTFLFVAFSRNPARLDAPHTLYAGRLGEKEIRRVGEVTSKVRYAAGHLFYVRAGQLTAVPFDAEKLAFTGDPAVIADDVSYFFPTASASFSVADDGTVAWVRRTRPNRIVLTDGTGATLREIAGNEDFTEWISAMADGSQVVVARRDATFGTFDLWMYGIDRPSATRLTFDSLDESSPVVSADGSLLYYGSDRKGMPDLYVKQVYGGEGDRLILEAPAEQRAADVSRDGNYLLYLTGSRTNAANIYALSLRDGKTTVAAGTPARETAPRLSPDGSLLAYQSDTSGRDEVYVQPFLRPGVPRQVSFGEGQSPKWSPGGDTIFFLSGGRTIMRAAVSAATIGEPQVVFRHAQKIETFEPLPNGRFVLVLVDAEAESLPGNVIVRWPETLAARE